METPAALATLVEALPADLCAACVGRLFARALPGSSNEARGRSLRPTAPAPSPSCPGCEGISGRFDHYAEAAHRAASDYEHDSFLVGCILPLDVRRQEARLHELLAEAAPDRRTTSAPGKAPVPVFAGAEFLKNEFNREVGKRLEAASGRRVDFARPDVTYMIDTRLDHVRLQVASVFVRGRYLKLDRSLPQTHWPCRACSGLGCRACDYQGKTYPSSVEELVAAPFLDAAGATAESFHGMGREDIDARMLGTGRPFVLELKEPRRRRFDLTPMAGLVESGSDGRVQVRDLAFTDPGVPARYKAADPDKTYRAHCVAEPGVDVAKLLNSLPSFAGARLDQRTPERVAHRRADLVRPKRIHEVRFVAGDRHRFELEIRAESGTYIKEFVSGDQGRTRPSVSEALGSAVRVDALDVIDIDWKE